MSSLDEMLDSIAVEFLELCQELMMRRSVLDDLLAESSIHLARAQLSQNSQCSLALSMLQFNPSLTPSVTVVADRSNSACHNFSEVLLSNSGNSSDPQQTHKDLSCADFASSSEDSYALVCQWDKDNATLIPGTVSKFTSVSSTPSSVKSAKYYYEKSIEEIVNVASLQNKLENMRKQYRKLRRLKLLKLKNSSSDSEHRFEQKGGDPMSLETSTCTSTISLNGDVSTT